MDADALRVESSPEGGDVQDLRDRLNEYNVARTGRLDGSGLALFVRGADCSLRAGLYGTTWSGWLEILLLWVHEEERGRGLGSRLLASAEAEGRRRGCHTAILDTYSFQAPAFYERHGYVEYARLDGYPTGHSKLFMRKGLGNQSREDEK